MALAEIIPAILEENFKSVAEKLKLVDGLVNWVQLDITDGLFAPSISWQTPSDLATVTRRSKIEVHLMLEQPEGELDRWLAVSDRILVHYEATNQLDKILDVLASAPVEGGLALLLQTPLDVLGPAIERIKVVQLLGIEEIGHQGHLLDRRVLQRIKILRVRYPSVTIAVDGGVNLVNAPELLAAGVNNLVIGSALWQSKNPLATLREFQKLIS